MLPELQQGEKSMSSPPNENSAKSVFMQSTRTVRFKFLTTPNSSHETESYRQNSLKSWEVRKSDKLLKEAVPWPVGAR